MGLVVNPRSTGAVTYDCPCGKVARALHRDSVLN